MLPAHFDDFAPAAGAGRRQKRERLDLYASVLRAIFALERERIAPTRTRISDRVNLPYDRAVVYCDELVALGLVGVDNRLRSVTTKGRVFLEAYTAWRAAVADVGLGEA